MFHINHFRYIIFGIILLINTDVFCQVNYTGNDQVKPYDGNFGYGFNPGYNPPWTDEQLADIGAGTDKTDGLKANCIRPTLPEHFMEAHGYELRVKTLKHYHDLGLVDNTMFVGYPSDAHRDTKIYCEGKKAEVFANMYEPIWDNGENGTPVNDNNYYALYLYKTVTLYKDYVRFWEIWNEPDFDYTFSKGWLPDGIVNRGNWWDNNPEPCDYALKAPVFYYVRMLRISWEVIKTLDPDAYVTTGGLGYPSFLDAILRNTDNPVDGSPTDEFSKKGGAYFDVLSYHSYPHNDGSLKKRSSSKTGFVQSRHSDAASQGVIAKKEEFEKVLFDYGYNGKKYPEKLWILTEVNIPSVQHEEYLGSDLAQRNFIIKSLINSQQNDILQYHVYSLGEGATFDGGSSDFRSMGMFEKLEGVQPYKQKFKESGVAFKTTSLILKGKKYDPVKTLNMALPKNVGGAAFIDKNGNHTYAMWAKTTKDMSEQASATYKFPSMFGYQELAVKKWDFGNTEKVEIKKEKSLKLNSTPIFVSANPFVFNIDKATGSKQSVTRSMNSFSSNSAINFIHPIEKIAKRDKDINRFNLTVKVKGKGEVKILSAVGSKISNCTGHCTNQYLENSKVSLSAIPERGYSFVGWEESKCQKEVTCTFNLTSNMQITAKFEKHNSTNTSRPNYSGPTEKVNNSNTNTTTTTSQSGQSGMRYDSSMSDMRDNGMNDASYPVKVRIIGPGAVLIQSRGYPDQICEGECTFTYGTKTHLTFSAIPADDHSFTGWIGTGCYGTAQCYRILDWEMEVNVNFVPGLSDIIYEEEEIAAETPLNITVKGAGKIVITTTTGYKYECRSNCNETVTQNSRISMLAVPIHGHYFVGWEGDASVCKGTGKCFMKVKTDKEITAVFAPIKHMIPKTKN